MMGREVVLCVVAGLLLGCDGSSATDTPEPRSDTLVVMSYNIFHDGERASHGIAPWPERRSAVVDLIRSRAPDVVGLQEAKSWQITWLLEQMPEFAAVARGVRADAGDADAETVGILYLRERFRLEDEGHFWYSDTPDQPGAIGGAAHGEPSGPRMATWVRLSDVSAPEGFYVFNTHLIADEHAVDPGLARARSAELLVERIEARAHADEPVLVTGDLNTTPAGWPVRYLLGERCDDGGACGAPASTRMIDTWASLHTGAAGTRCSVGPGSDGPRVDYVLVAEPSAARDAPRVTHAEIVTDGDDCPSDHRPVVATVVLP